MCAWSGVPKGSDGGIPTKFGDALFFLLGRAPNFDTPMNGEETRHQIIGITGVFERSQGLYSSVGLWVS